MERGWSTGLLGDGQLYANRTGLKFLPFNDQTNALRKMLSRNGIVQLSSGRSILPTASERESPHTGAKGTDKPMLGRARCTYTSDNPYIHRKPHRANSTSGTPLSLYNSFPFSSTPSAPISGTTSHSRNQLPSMSLIFTGRFSSRLILPALRIVVVNTVFAIVGSPCLS